MLSEAAGGAAPREIFADTEAIDDLATLAPTRVRRKSIGCRSSARSAPST
jgi:hypothetical protein